MNELRLVLADDHDLFRTGLRNLLADQGLEIAGEASTTYLYEYERTIKNIREANGTQARALKIIIVLRNPAERIFSHYCHYRLCGL